MSIPEVFLCPLTRTIMTEPVSLNCGHTFEKASILEYQKYTPRSEMYCPICGHLIGDTKITPWYLKNMIEDFKSQKENEMVKPLAINNIRSTFDIHDREINLELFKPLINVVYKQNDKTYFRIEVPKMRYRRPISFVCLIDVSESMETPIGKTHPTKKYTRLDIVKHLLCVIVAILKDKDNLSIITFSKQPEILFELTRMSKQNKILALNYIKSIKTNCNKYISPALTAAYAEIKKAPENHIKSIILLTDGHDTAGDDMVLHMFDRIQKPEKTQLNTFGFSNEIKSSCLEKLAKQGGGIFCFIPDQSMIGTIFINFLANTFLTFAYDVHIELNDNNFEFELAEQPRKISLQYGQKRYFMIRKKNPSYIGIPSLKIGLDKTNMIELKLSSNINAINDSEIEQQKSRYEMLKFVCDNRFPKVNLDS